MTKLRILQVLPAFGTGGVEEGTLAVSQALVHEGHTSIIASAGGQKVKQAEEGGAIHITLPLDRKSPWLILPMISELSDIIRQHKIDIVHARSRWPAWLAHFAAKRCNVPFMTTFHGYHKSNNFIKSLYNSIMVRTPHTIPVSNFMHDYIQETYPATLKKYKTQLHTIPRGVDHNRFDPDSVTDREVEDLRNSWKIDSDTKLILLPARMTTMKGHDVFVSALPYITSQNWAAILVGGQDNRAAYQSKLESKIAQLGFADKVKCIAAIHNMPVAYKLADAVVYPAIQPEAFGRVIIEAQAMGKPIITSDIGEPAAVVKHGINGWKFKSRDPQDLAQKIDAVLSLTTEQLHELSHTARQSVLDNYTKDIMCARTLEVYKNIFIQDKKH